MTNTLHILIVAWTLHREAASEGEYGMTLCASTIYNRAVASGKPPVYVCLKRKQYSCWNRIQSPVAWIERGTIPVDDAWPLAMRLAQQLVTGRFSPITKATHYHVWSITPRWTRGMVLCTRAGKHVFWRGKA